jgi:hypothetical protein
VCFGWRAPPPSGGSFLQLWGWSSAPKPRQHPTPPTRTPTHPTPQLVVGTEFKRLFQEREQWRKSRWDRVAWQLEEPPRIRDIKMVQGR